MTSGDDNTRAVWVCAIWAGVATRLIQERKAKEPPMTERAVAQIRANIQASLQGHPYLEEPAREALAALDRPGPHDVEKCPECGGPVRAKGLSEGGGVACTKCPWWFCY